MLSKFFKISLFWSSYIPIFAMVFLANLHDFSKASVKALQSLLFFAKKQTKATDFRRHVL